MKKLLAISFRFPYPPIDGYRIRAWNICKILSEKYLVDLLAINEDDKIPAEHIKEAKKYFNEVIVFSFKSMNYLTNAFKGIFSKTPLQSSYYYFKEVQEWINQHYLLYDLLFCFHIRSARYLMNIIDRPKVIDLVDATSINYFEAKERAKGIWKLIYTIENFRLLAYEVKMLEIFDKAFITSRYDLNYLKKHYNRHSDNIILIPNGVREELFNRNKNFGQTEDDMLVFLGKMNYFPNVDAVIHFARNVFPLVRQKASVKFYIVGTSPTKDVLRLRNMECINVTGFVSDPYEYLERAKVVVSPIRFSAGIQNKVIEAMALGKPVVTTTKVSRGIEGENGIHFIIADEDKEMATRIIELLANKSKREKIGANARKLVEEKYQWHIIKERLFKEIEYALN